MFAPRRPRTTAGSTGSCDNHERPVRPRRSPESLQAALRPGCLSADGQEARPGAGTRATFFSLFVHGLLSGRTEDVPQAGQGGICRASPRV